MADEAKIRIRLDTTGAQADLQALYRDLAKAPSVPVGAAAGAGGVRASAAAPVEGGAAQAPGGGFFGGLGRPMMLGAKAAAGFATAAYGRDTVTGAFDIFRASTTGGSMAVRDAILGNSASVARAELKTIDQVSDMPGVALGVGLGQISNDQLFNIQEALNAINRPTEEGRDTIRRVLGTRAQGNVGDELLKQANTILERIWQAITDLPNSIGLG